MRKLYRSSTDRVISGVCGGLGEYLNVDAVIIRLLWALLFFVGGAGLIAYIVAAIVIPLEPIGVAEKKVEKSSKTSTPSFVPLLIGLFLVLLGVSALGHNMGWYPFGWATFRHIMWIFFPAVFIIFGFLLIFRSLADRNQSTAGGRAAQAEPLPSPDGDIKKKSAGTKAKTAEIKEEPSYSKAASYPKEKKAETQTQTNKKKQTENNMGNVASNTKKLYRDMDNRMISGVCSGLAEYLDLDVSIVRVLWIIMTIMTGIVGGVIAYLLMVFIVPMK